MAHYFIKTPLTQYPQNNGKTMAGQDNAIENFWLNESKMMNKSVKQLVYVLLYSQLIGRMVNMFEVSDFL